MTSQKRCCPAVNGWRRTRPIAGALAISYKKREDVAASTLGRERCRSRRRGYGWMRPIKRPSTLWFYLKRLEEAFSVNI